MAMGKFKPEQTRRIDELISSNFADATPEDIQLYAEWKAEEAKSAEEFRQYIEIQQKESEERVKIAREESENAKNALNALVDEALERYKAISKAGV